MDRKLHTVAETAKLLKCNTNLVYLLIKAGLLECLKLGCIKIRDETIDNFLIKWEGWDISDPFHPKKLKGE